MTNIGGFAVIVKGALIVILEVDNLQKRFSANGKTLFAVDGISFFVNEGECFGLIGQSGCGKSTTANIVSGLLKPDDGSIRFKGKEISSKGRVVRNARNGMQFVFQMPQNSFDPRMKIMDCLLEPMRFSKEKLTSKEKKKRAFEALEKVGLKSEYADMYSWQMSGGECQRAAIARALVCKSDFLICDEVTSALDVSIQAQIINLLAQLKQEEHLSFLFISHDLAVVSNLCERVAVMYNGRIVETGKTLDVINNPKHPYTKLLILSALHPGQEENWSEDYQYEKSRS